MIKKQLYKWHRLVSVTIAIPVLLWAASGFMHPLMTNIRPKLATQTMVPEIIERSRIHQLVLPGTTQGEEPSGIPERNKRRLNDQGLLEDYSFAFLHKHEFMSWGGKGVKDLSTMFWASAQILLVSVGLWLYVKKRKRSADFC